ncbi:MAG: NfeD family protein [Rudaea sp.]
MKRKNQANARIDTRRFSLWGVLAVGAVLILLRFVVPGYALAQGQPRVDVARIDGVIDLAAQGYVERAIGLAEQDGAQALVIQLDTPGGASDAMDDIIKAILASRVPVIVYVWPPGGRAASAGTFITYAAHIAAMAPDTRIGAAHPVDATGADITGDMRSKVMEDSIKSIQGLAERRGRNVDWATRAVSESLSATAQEAVDGHIVDLIANDMTDLLNKVNGRTVTLANGQATLRTAGAPTHDIDMTIFEEIFHILIDPNLAAILLSVGSLAILVELYNPGSVLPAITGVICIILGLVSLRSLPTNWAAVLLIFAGILMFVVDIKVTGFVLTLGGIVALVLGFVFLFRPFTPPEPSAPVVSVSPFVIAGLVILMTAFFLVVVRAAVRSRMAPVVSGITPFMGATGEATSDLDPEGTAWVKGEDWTAVAQGSAIQKGERIKVVAIDGLRLKVVREAPESPPK